MLTRELAGAAAKPFILAILTQQESYGYTIWQRIEALSDGTLSWDDSPLYPVLHCLDNQGLLTSSWREPDNQQRRTYYTPTVKEKKALVREKRQWLHVDAMLVQLWDLPPHLS